ncbi:serine/threonine-protein kinase TIO [Morus notabilis]|uniref:serine/threonine-protein kinase TIO n=1 Tax=Morus notabilis TaxID=981085 RepID=UPI000CECF461|nr:serine/threonine-protein kinase TIO [Morus notabilis]
MFLISFLLKLPGVSACCYSLIFGAYGVRRFGRRVAVIAKMISYQPLAVQVVSKGLLDPNQWRRLLDYSSPKEVLPDALMIVSDFARMDKIGNAALHGELRRSIPQVGNLSLSAEEDKTKLKCCGCIRQSNSQLQRALRRHCIRRSHADL